MRRYEQTTFTWFKTLLTTLKAVEKHIYQGTPQPRLGLRLHSSALNTGPIRFANRPNLDLCSQIGVYLFALTYS